ncbi:DUF791-domain-containing protein [Aureobasidium subglaciale]|nr:DUF791-domain-containing protein [Aureobasidium subglaciale]
MAFYETNLVILAAVSAYLLYRQHRLDKQSSVVEAENGMKSALGRDAIQRFKRAFFPAYALVCAADWLQKGPHIYALYKYHKHLPETTVAALYASGFVAAALSASFVGQLADKYGRRSACLLYCIIYSIACLSMLSDDLLILFAGRACGGVSTTLLYSVFETWMIAEYHDQALDAYGLSLGSMFGKMTTLSGVVAIVSGVVGDLLIRSLDSKTSPFMASIVCLMLAFAYISKHWNENYGDNASSKDKDGEPIDQSQVLFSNSHYPRIISIGLASCFFEGSMYMFVFFWSAALSTVHANIDLTSPLPFGVVFSSYMCAMMIGSIVFTLIPPSSDKAHYILKMVLTSASICFLSSVLLKSEALVFWAFCLIEVCVGAYFPSMASLKGKLIQDGSRGRIYGILRLPLNLFVIVAHSLAEEGDQHRNNVFMTCGGLLLVAFVTIEVEVRSELPSCSGRTSGHRETPARSFYASNSVNQAAFERSEYYCLDQETILQKKLHIDTFVSLLKGCPKLITVEIWSGRVKPHMMMKARRLFADAKISPADVNECFDSSVKGLIAVFRALERSGVCLRQIVAGRLSHDVFHLDHHDTTLIKAELAKVHSLALNIEELHPPEVFLASALRSRTAEISERLSDGALSESLRAAPSMRYLSIRMSSLRYNHAVGPLDVNRTFGKQVFKHLRYLNLDKVAANSSNLERVLIDHGNTLRSIRLTDFTMRNHDSWTRFFAAISQKLPNIRKFMLYGRWTGKHAEYWDFSRTLDGRSTMETHAMSNFLREGGTLPTTLAEFRQHVSNPHVFIHARSLHFSRRKRSRDYIDASNEGYIEEPKTDSESSDDEDEDLKFWKEHL